MSEIPRATFKAREAAEYLGISYWLILEMAKRGEIPHIRAGRLVLLRKEALEKEALDRWMDEQERSNFREGGKK